MSITLEAITFIKSKIGDFQPKLALMLGSGLNSIADEIENPQTIHYGDIPGFPRCSVEGHYGELIFGTLSGTPIVCLKGRAHFYEGNKNHTLRTFIHALKGIGVEAYFATNASGSLRPDVVAGDLVVVKDHINFQFMNPLVGPNDTEFGPRFVGMEEAYDLQFREQLFEIAHSEKINLVDGVYIGVLGPSFETPAEIRAFKILGADVVGMSTVPEVIIARHCGLKVACISVISNLAVGLTDTPLTHDETLKGAALGKEKLIKIAKKFIGQYAA